MNGLEQHKRHHMHRAMPLTRASTKVEPLLGRHCIQDAQLMAHNPCISKVPVIVTYCAPGAVDENLNSALQVTRATGKTNWQQLSCREGRFC